MSGSNGDNALQFNGSSPFLGVTQSDPVPTTWAPSNWKPGMPPTARSVDTSAYPMPTQDQIEQQRQLIQANLRKYGYQPQQLSDIQVLSTMSNQPQHPKQFVPWVEDYISRHPEESAHAARPGVDLPFNLTYTDTNLKNPALNPAVPTSVGYASTEPQGALLEHFGQPWVDQADRNWFAMIGGDPRNMTQGTYTPGKGWSGRDVSGVTTGGVQMPDAATGSAPSGPAMYSTTSAPAVSAGGAMPTYGAQPYPAYASGTPNAAPDRNMLALASSSPAAANWMQQLQQQNPSFWQQLMRWIGLRQQQYGSDGSAGGGDGFFAGGGGPKYTIGNVPAVPQARQMTYTTGS